MFVIEYDGRPDGYDNGPPLVGPFPDREAAERWAGELALRVGGSWSWGVAPLVDPDTGTWPIGPVGAAHTEAHVSWYPRPDSFV